MDFRILGPLEAHDENGVPIALSGRQQRIVLGLLLRECLVGARLVLGALSFLRHRSSSVQPPIGARGFAPQKTRVPIIPMMWTSTMLSTIDFAVAVPTPTGPPDAVYP